MPFSEGKQARRTLLINMIAAFVVCLIPLQYKCMRPELTTREATLWEQITSAQAGNNVGFLAWGWAQIADILGSFSPEVIIRVPAILLSVVVVGVLTAIARRIVSYDFLLFLPAVFFFALGGNDIVRHGADTIAHVIPAVFSLYSIILAHERRLSLGLQRIISACIIAIASVLSLPALVLAVLPVIILGMYHKRYVLPELLPAALFPFFTAMPEYQNSWWMLSFVVLLPMFGLSPLGAWALWNVMKEKHLQHHAIIGSTLAAWAIAILLCIGTGNMMTEAIAFAIVPFVLVGFERLLLLRKEYPYITAVAMAVIFASTTQFILAVFVELEILLYEKIFYTTFVASAIVAVGAAWRGVALMLSPEYAFWHARLLFLAVLLTLTFRGNQQQEYTYHGGASETLQVLRTFQEGELYIYAEKTEIIGNKPILLSAYATSADSLWMKNYKTHYINFQDSKQEHLPQAHRENMILLIIPEHFSSNAKIAFWKITKERKILHASRRFILLGPVQTPLQSS